jgi:ABC-type amino acid transport substrate-binding protein
MSANSQTSGGALEPEGEVFDSAPYGWPVANGPALAEWLRQALEHVVQTGEYRTIATMWASRGDDRQTGNQRRDQVIAS